MQKFLGIGLGAALTFVGSLGLCGGLFAPFSMDSAGVMPKGVRSVRLGGFSSEISDKYSASGSIVPLAQSFNKAVTWQDLINSQPGGFERGQFRGGVESLGINMSDVAGDSRGIVESRITTTLPVVAYGITDRLTAGVGVPILYSNVNVSSGWAANEAFQAKLDDLSRKGFFNKVLSYEDQLQNVVDTKIKGYGYEPLRDESRTDIGDVTLGLKYQTFKSTEFAVALATKVVAPTGRVSDVNKVVDIASGDGQWDLGLGAVVDYAPTAKLTLTYGLGYTYQMASQKAKRLPTSADESLSGDIDRDVTEKLGDTMGTNLGVRYQVLELWSLASAYSLQYKAPDTYSGSQFASERYGYLADNSEQAMQSVQVGMTYSTIPLFRSGKFALPLDASITFSSVLDGRNVNKINLTAIDIASYF